MVSIARRNLFAEGGRLFIRVGGVAFMEIDPTRAKAELTYQGKTYYFCAEGCLQLFQKEPAQFLGSMHQASPRE